MDVYELGFGNNPRAVPTLVKLAKSGDDDIARAAISSLGTLRASGQLGLLVELFEAQGDMEDRAIALKALGDLGTAESKGYLNQQKAALESQTDRESTVFKEIIALYMYAIHPGPAINAVRGPKFAEFDPPGRRPDRHLDKLHRYAANLQL